MATSKQVDFYFDYISHNAYLAWHVLPELSARYGYTLRPIPVLFAGFLKAFGQLGPAEILPKLHWMNRNNMRKALTLGLPFAAPKKHPFNPLLLLRLCAQDMREELRSQLTALLLSGVWVDALDPEDPAAITAYLGARGCNVNDLIASAGSAAAKDAVRANTDEAIARGGFGVPTMIVDQEVFWGYDDLPWLERYLAGADPLARTDIADFEKAWSNARADGHHRRRN